MPVLSSLFYPSRLLQQGASQKKVNWSVRTVLFGQGMGPEGEGCAGGEKMFFSAVEFCFVLSHLIRVSAFFVLF